VADLGDDADLPAQVVHADGLADQKRGKPGDGSLTWGKLGHDGEDVAFIRCATRVSRIP
jgi:hypothetical protein